MVKHPQAFSADPCMKSATLRSLGTSTDTRRLTNAGLMLAHRLRRWTNIKPALVQALVYLVDRHGQVSRVLHQAAVWTTLSALPHPTAPPDSSRPLPNRYYPRATKVLLVCYGQLKITSVFQRFIVKLIYFKPYIVIVKRYLDLHKLNMHLLKSTLICPCMPKYTYAVTLFSLKF